MDGDRPITRRDDDRLGFAPVAAQLARTIVDQSASQGLVFGIEGKWGSGKTTLINLTIEALKAHGDAAPEIIAFSPWLVGDRDELLRSLFDELAAVAVKIDPVEPSPVQEKTNPSRWAKLQRVLNRDAHWQLRQKERLKKEVGAKLKVFGSLAGAAGKLARVAGTLGIPGGDLVGSVVERGGDATREFLGAQSVSSRKAELVSALRLLSRRIIVFIDDLDRLEPREASEVLRLIRAVADFPNIIYVLSYDPEVIAQTLSKAVQVDDGAAFLEKIVQVSFRVPRPEAFDLRRWFQAEVYELFPGEFDAAVERQGSLKQRLAQTIDMQGGRYLQTGRDVVRALNALRLHAVPVHGSVDIPDMVWLQLVRIGNPKFYSWVEEYLTEVAAIANGARVTDGAASAMKLRLENILREENLDLHRSAIELEDILPGVDGGLGVRRDGEELRIFNDLQRNVIDRFVASRRLGSPQHYRYYYAFSHPAGALPDQQIQAFIEVAERSPADAIQMFTDLIRVTRPQGGTLAEVLVDGLIAWLDRIPEGAIPGIISSFAETMDAAALSSEQVDFGEHAAWRSAKRATAVLLKRTAGNIRAACLHTLFAQGRALGWLTHILRSEIFSHGHYGDHAEPEDNWLLTSAEFTDALSTMFGRYREMPAAELMRVPDLMSLLYAWRQGSGTEEARQWVGAQTATDAGLLDFLSHARGWAASSNVGVYHPLKRRDLENFLDYENAVQRVEAISLGAEASAADRQLALELMTAIEQGRDH